MTPLSALREFLGRQGLTGLIIPHSDEYQNEYLPPCAERLAWLTGFTGSAGTAVVLKTQAAIFVDGRYTLQVAGQVDANQFSIHHSGTTSPNDWISHEAQATERIGYDPRLHTPNELEQYQKAAEQANAQLIPCESNPIDEIWQDRPGSPMALVQPHPEHYAGQSSQEKRNRLCRNFAQEHIDAAVVTSPDSIAWLLNIRGADVPHTPLPLSHAILYGTGEVVLFLPHQKVSGELRNHLGSDVTITSPEDFEAALEKLGRDKQRVLCDPSKTNSWVFRVLSEHGATIVKGEDPCALPKACKNETEILGAYAAHRRDAVAVCQFLAWLARESSHGTVTELDAAAYLEECRKKQPLWKDASFPTISGAGANGAIVHYRSSQKTNRKLEDGTLYLVDSGGQYLDGTTDITRTLAIGTPSEEHRDRYTRVLKGHIALATARFPEGTTGSQLDALARAPLWVVGLDYDHGTGHGVGSYLGVHEGPHRIAKGVNTVALRPGMIVSNEPGYYKAGAYGIRLENLVVVIPETKLNGSDRLFFTFDTITIVPFDRSLIERTLLSDQECSWLNAYHVRIWNELRDAVEGETRKWLDGATRPL
ncbi:MAG: aminopeptidase P family protein [Nitrospirales bacterium]